MTSGSPFGTTCGSTSTPRRVGTPWNSSATSTGNPRKQAAAVLLNCSVADLEKLPARSPPNLPRTKQEEPKQLAIPAAHKDMRGVFAYLCQTRGITSEVVVRLCEKGAPLRERRPSQCCVCWLGWTRQGEAPPRRGTLTVPPFAKPYRQRKRVQLPLDRVPAGNCTPLKHPSICCPTFLCTRRDGRTTPMLPCAG